MTMSINEDKRTPSEEHAYSIESKLRPTYRGKDGWKFNSSIHAAAQARDRHPEKTENEYHDLHAKVLNAIKNDHTKSNGDHLFFSKSHEMGYVARVNHKKRSVDIVTVLPKNKSFAKEGTKKVVTESTSFLKTEFGLDFIVIID